MHLPRNEFANKPLQMQVRHLQFRGIGHFGTDLDASSFAELG